MKNKIKYTIEILNISANMNLIESIEVPKIILVLSKVTVSQDVQVALEVANNSF